MISITMARTYLTIKHIVKWLFKGNFSSNKYIIFKEKLAYGINTDFRRTSDLHKLKLRRIIISEKQWIIYI